MTNRCPPPVVIALGVLSALLLGGCGREDRGATSGGHPLLGTKSAVVLAPGDGALTDADEAQRRFIDAARAAPIPGDTPAVVVDNPRNGSVYPPDIVAPTFTWTDATEGADTWLLDVAFEGDDAARLAVLVPGDPPPPAEIDEACVAETNELPEAPGAFDRSFTPPRELWETMKKRSRERWATLTITGRSSAAPGRALSVARLRFRTSEDPVGAPIFYRDVPLAPSNTEKGVIKPLADDAVALIKWRLRDIGRPESRVVLERMVTCANCHSFSLDGTTFGMDVDGPQGDKGTYAFLPVRKQMVIDYENIITWNDYPKKPKGHNTLGFLSRVSPTGRYAVTTLNEAVYVANFLDYRFLQVFYPTRGILAYYDRKTHVMDALPGADDPAYVHCDAVWSPDGSEIVFARAPAKDPYQPGVPLAKYANDPNETKIQYDLYRMPFDGGRGGKPEPIPGASQNGMSNTFPKVSPDGKWIVFVKCRNGQLMRPDGKLWIVPYEGGEARELACNTWRMNSWHSFSPNSRWLVFSSKANTPYTQMFLTHLDEQGNASPPILVPNSTAANRAVNIPEFMNAPYDALQRITVPGVRHRRDIDRGYEMLDEGRIDDAVAFFERAVSVNPKNAPAHVGLGWALHLKGKEDAARTEYEKAVAIDPTNVRAHTNLGFALFERGQTDAAIRHYRLALAQEPADLLTLKNLTRAYIEKNRFPEALETARRVLGMEDGNLDIHRDLGLIYLRLGRPDAAVPHLERVVKEDPDALDVANSLAWERATCALDPIRDGPKAVQIAERIVKRTKRENAAYLDTLAAAYAEAGRFEDAVAAAEEALGRLGSGGGPLRDAIRERITFYRAREPFRVPLPK